jgi:lipopolysaccharide biosynthesis glycosyltransferase
MKLLNIIKSKFKTMKNDTLVFTIAIGENYQRMAKITHPSIRAYAKKIGADFKSLEQQTISKTTPHWDKFMIFDLLNQYTRILYVDTDIIIRDDTPNLFEIVPPFKLGMFNESPWTNRSQELMIDICKKYGETLPDWDGRYFNTGVMVLSKQHKYLFKKPEKEIFSFYEQTWLNLKIALEKPQMYELPYKYNRLSCMDKFLGEERFASYIIHYAGYPNLEWILNLIPKDIEKWKQAKGNYKYQRHIYINVSGGLGDQINSLPAIKFLRNKVYPEADIVVATHFPRIFEHLKDKMTIVKQGEASLKDDTPYYLMNSLPGPETSTWMTVSNLLCHTVDYCSIALLRRTLPMEDKQVELKVNLQDVANLIDIIGIRDLSELVVVHAGRHWDSKTFPKQWWQEIVDKLVAKGLKVCLIGKDEVGDKTPDNYDATFGPGSRGTVDIKCPEGVIDLRNLLDLGSLMALLQSAKVLISNDSAPIHVAGSFENWIILIESCKHKDHVLPIRHGQTNFKTVAMAKKLLLDEINSQPTCVEGSSADIKVKDWSKYLPTSNEVVNKTLEICQNK